MLAVAGALSWYLHGSQVRNVIEADVRFTLVATARSNQLDEISGMQPSTRHEGLLWVHNDDGAPRVHALGMDGSNRGHFDIADAVNVDWEDMTHIPGTERDLLVLADIGDNDARRSNVWLYLVPEPDADDDGRFSGEHAPFNWISVTYPDGPRDSEAIAWDPIGERLIFLTKRDRPPRLYALPLDIALAEREAELVFLGDIESLRGPSAEDRAFFGDRVNWISQPTGMDISPDGQRAAIITYRSLYLFDLPASGDWLEGLQGEPTEILGPGRINEESVAFHLDGSAIWVSSEGDNPPLFRFSLEAEKP